MPQLRALSQSFSNSATHGSRRLPSIRHTTHSFCSSVVIRIILFPRTAPVQESSVRRTSHWPDGFSRRDVVVPICILQTVPPSESLLSVKMKRAMPCERKQMGQAELSSGEVARFHHAFTTLATTAPWAQGRHRLQVHSAVVLSTKRRNNWGWVQTCFWTSGP